MIKLEGKFGYAEVMIDTVEDECIKQIISMLNHPIFCKPVRVMPDCHSGKGSVIGFTMKLSHGVCPNTVGVDIGCGMSCWQTVLPDGFDFAKFDADVRKVLPLGMTSHEKPIATMRDNFDYDHVQRDANKFVATYNKLNGTSFKVPTIDYKWFTDLCGEADIKESQVNSSIATLGGGNHFVEIGKDKDNNHYLTVHSGSRNFGKKIAEHYQKLAQLKTYNKGFDKDYAYLIDDDAMEYYMAMILTQNFASMNRKLMGDLIAKAGGFKIVNMIESVHNYIDFHDMILRKGAISSYKNKLMVIPFNMKDGMAICDGKSNPGYNFSAPHGAGRIMSRSQAKRTLNLEDFEKEMDGIFTTSVSINTLDEAPGTYKPMSVILDAIKPTADIITMVKPVYNLKA